MPDAPPTLDVPALQRLTARSWRGLEEEWFGDWLLRAGGGFTGRANSALVLGEPPVPLAEAVAAVESWYVGRGLRARAQVPLPGAERADAALAAAGWTRDDDNLVLTAPLGHWAAPSEAVDLSPVPDDAWLRGYLYRGAPLPPDAYDVLVHADGPVFASVRLDPAPAPPAAVARGVLVDGWLCVSTAGCASRPSPSTRRTGGGGWRRR